jgi:transposase
MGRLSIEKKIKIIKRRRSGEELSVLAEEFSVSERQIQRWVKLYDKDGKRGLTSKSTKPKRSPNKLSESMVKRIIQCKRDNPYWRANKIAVELTNAGYPVSQPTVTKILEIEGINLKYTKTKNGYRRKLR